MHCIQLLRRREPTDPNEISPNVMAYVYFGIFDGHAGVGAALYASNQLHHIIHEKLVDIVDELLPDAPLIASQVTRDSLIIGALETAFAEMVIIFI